MNSQDYLTVDCESNLQTIYENFHLIGGFIFEDFP